MADAPVEPSPEGDERKIGRFSLRSIKGAIARDREAGAAATPFWHHSHGCVVDREGTIITWLEGQKNLYHGNAGRDPLKDLANARFMVSARQSVEARCDMMDALLMRINELETKAAQARTAAIEEGFDAAIKLLAGWWPDAVEHLEESRALARPTGADNG